MHWNLKTAIVIVFALALPITVSASGTTAADFLNISVSAYQASLGGAGTALSNDIAASYFNPAGLSLLEKPGINFMHNLWYQDISYEYLGGAFPIDRKSTIAVSAAYLHMGQIDAYNVSNQSDGTINPYSLAGIVSFSRHISGGLSIGLSGKYITEKLDDVSANGYAADIGAQYYYHDFSFGVVANNLGPKIKYEADSFSLPASISLGTSYSPYQLPVILMVGANLPFDGKTSFATGLEYMMTDFMSLRSGFGGMGNDEASNSLNFGAGLNVAGVHIDYALNPGGEQGQTHFFSFTLNFGDSRRAVFDNRNMDEITEAATEIYRTGAEPTPTAVATEEAIDQDVESVSPSYTVSAGSFADRESASKQVEVLKRFGIKGKVEARDDKTFSVTVARTDNPEKAEKIQKKIISEGFTAIITQE